MGTSHYFNNYSGVSTSEQRLFEDVVEESIKIMGHNCYYLPRDSYDSLDKILGERPESVFAKAYIVEMYLANVEGYEGDGDFFSRFGLEVRDTSNFIVSRRSFQRYIPSSVARRPREGDLFYVPVLQKIFEIKFVEEELMFMSLGNRNPYIYELRAEVFRYSQENINTGVDEVDNVEDGIAYTIKLALGAGAGNYNIGETVTQGSTTAKVTDWDSITKTLSVINIVNTFSVGSTVVGNDSTASYSISTIDELGENVYYDEFDNGKIQTEVADFIDLTEINPFGMP